MIYNHIGIIGAMEIEIDLLLQSISDVTKETDGSFIFYTGKLGKTTVTLLLSGIGKVAAAIGTTLLIERYNPDLIINTGTTGGLQNIQQGEIILANSCVYHDVDVTVFGYKKGQMAQQPASFIPDTAVSESIINTANKIIEFPTIKIGQILSGDSFMYDVERVKNIKEDFPNALAIDMESTAIAQVCYQLSCPFVVLRAVSDMAGEGNAQAYEEFVQVAGRLTASIISKYIITNQ